jgi:hypothetical protein
VACDRRRLLPAGYVCPNLSLSATHACQRGIQCSCTCSPVRARRSRPPTISAEAIAAAKVGGIGGEHIIAEAVRAARPEARNVAVDLGTIRWTDPKTSRRATFATPITVRDAPGPAGRCSE